MLREIQTKLAQEETRRGGPVFVDGAREAVKVDGARQAPKVDGYKPTTQLSFDDERRALLYDDKRADPTHVAPYLSVLAGGWVLLNYWPVIPGHTIVAMLLSTAMMFSRVADLKAQEGLMCKRLFLLSCGTRVHLQNFRSEDLYEVRIKDLERGEAAGDSPDAVVLKLGEHKSVLDLANYYVAKVDEPELFRAICDGKEVDLSGQDARPSN